MNDLAVLSLPPQAPPQPATETAPAQQQAPDKGQATDFATELNRQIAATDDTSPGPGRDAGKGRETDESDPATEATERPPVEGQSAKSGREAGSDRLALVVQLLAATLASSSSASPAATANGTPATDTASAATGVAGAASAAGATAATAATATSASTTAPAQTPEAIATQASSQSVSQTATGDQTQTGVVPGAPVTAARATDTTTPAAQPTAADAAVASAAATAATATAATESVPVVVAAADNVGTQANTAADQAASAKGAGRATAGKPAPAANAGGAVQPGAAESAPASGAVTRTLKGGDDQAAEAPAAGAKLVVKETTAPASARTQADQSPQGDGTTALTGTQATLTQPADASPADKATLSQPVIHSAIDQIVAGAKLVRQGPVTEMRLQLKPEFLGRVDLKVTMEGGVLSARIMVDNPQVKAAIEANLPQLRQDLAQQGIALQGMTVGLGGGRGQQQAGDSQQSGFRWPGQQYQNDRDRTLSPVATGAQRSASSSHRLDLVL